MISSTGKYWSTGITLAWREAYLSHGESWSGSLDYFDDGFCNDSPDTDAISTQGALRTRYGVEDTDTTSALAAVVDALILDAARLGITWRGPAGEASMLYYRAAAELPGTAGGAGAANRVGDLRLRAGREGGCVMGREVKRVPLDFNHPLKRVWPGYLRPDILDEDPCPDCKNGYSPHAQNLHDLWYGHLPFHPAITGCAPLTLDTPAVRAFAERNIANAPDYYGEGESAIVREATRLCGLWNGSWSHHLAQEDVDALVAGGRLMDFTHIWSREARWQKIEPPVTLTAAQVNEWSLNGIGHDSINAHIAVAARCERDGFPERCATCKGHGSIEAYPGQRAEAEAWQRTEPPTGEGWQLWETVSEGSPISPVFASADELAAWMSDPQRGRNWVPGEVARKFIADGWAPSFVGSPRTGLVSGVG